MSLAVVAPDAVDLTRKWLLAQPELAALVATRITTRSPSSPTYPYLTLQRIGGSPLSARAGIDQASIQVSAWGATDEQASDVARYALASLSRMENHRTAGGVASFTRVELGISWVPDTVRNPPTPRFIFTAAVVARPAH